MTIDNLHNIEGLDEYDLKVLKAIEPGYDVAIVRIPGDAGINDFAAGGSLAVLKKRGFIRFEGRGSTKSCYLTPEGEAAYAQAFPS